MESLLAVVNAAEANENKRNDRDCLSGESLQILEADKASVLRGLVERMTCRPSNHDTASFGQLQAAGSLGVDNVA